LQIALVFPQKTATKTELIATPSTAIEPNEANRETDQRNDRRRNFVWEFYDGNRNIFDRPSGSIARSSA
jgi:hypothetical protein